MESKQAWRIVWDALHAGIEAAECAGTDTFSDAELESIYAAMDTLARAAGLENTLTAMGD